MHETSPTSVENAKVLHCDAVFPLQSDTKCKLQPLFNALVLCFNNTSISVLDVASGDLVTSLANVGHGEFAFLQTANKLIYIGVENEIKCLSPTRQGTFLLGDSNSDSCVRITLSEAIHLLAILEDQESSWSGDVVTQRDNLLLQLQAFVGKSQSLNIKQQQWVVFTSNDYNALQPLLQDVASQMIFDPDRSIAIHGMLARVNAHVERPTLDKHPSNKKLSILHASLSGDTLVTASDDGAVGVWDLTSDLRFVSCLPCSTDTTTLVYASPCTAPSRYILTVCKSTSEDGFIELFDAGKKDAVSMHRLSINEHCPLGAVYIPELSKLIVGVENSRTAEHQLAIYSIKIETKTVEHEKSIPCTALVKMVPVIIDTRIHSIAILFADGYFGVFDLVSAGFSHYSQTNRFGHDLEYCDNRLYLNDGEHLFVYSFPPESVLPKESVGEHNTSGEPVSNIGNSPFVDEDFGEFTTQTSSDEFDFFGKYERPQQQGSTFPNLHTRNENVTEKLGSHVETFNDFAFPVDNSPIFNNTQLPEHSLTSNERGNGDISFEADTGNTPAGAPTLFNSSEHSVGNEQMSIPDANKTENTKMDAVPTDALFGTNADTSATAGTPIFELSVIANDNDMPLTSSTEPKVAKSPIVEHQHENNDSPFGQFDPVADVFVTNNENFEIGSPNSNDLQSHTNQNREVANVAARIDTGIVSSNGQAESDKFDGWSTGSAMQTELDINESAATSNEQQASNEPTNCSKFDSSADQNDEFDNVGDFAGSNGQTTEFDNFGDFHANSTKPDAEISKANATANAGNREVSDATGSTEFGAFGGLSTGPDPAGHDYGFDVGDFTAASNGQSNDFDTFGDFSASSTIPDSEFSPPNATASADDVTGPSEKADETTEFGDFTGQNDELASGNLIGSATQADEATQVADLPASSSESVAFGDFGNFTAASTAQKEVNSDFGDFTAPSDQTGDFGDFGDFNSAVPEQNEDFDSFGGFASAQDGAAGEDFGDFATEASTGEFGSFETAPAVAPQPELQNNKRSLFNGDEGAIRQHISQIFTAAHSELDAQNAGIADTHQMAQDIVAVLSHAPPLFTNKCYECGTKLPLEAMGCLVCGTKTSFIVPTPEPRRVLIPPSIAEKFWVSLGVPSEFSASLPSPVVPHATGPPVQPQPQSEQFSIDPTTPNILPHVPIVKPLRSSWDFTGSEALPPPQIQSQTQATSTAPSPTVISLGNLDFLDNWGDNGAKPSRQAVIPQDEFFLGSFVSATTPSSSLHTSIAVTQTTNNNAGKFISLIPNLSFMTSSTLSIPTQ